MFFLRNNPFCNNLLSLIFRYFSVLPSLSLHIIYKVSSLILHCFSIVTMDNRWTIYGQLSNEELMKTEGRAKEERRKNRLVALKDFAQFVECLPVVFIQFRSPAHITMHQLRASGLDYGGKYIYLWLFKHIISRPIVMSRIRRMYLYFFYIVLKSGITQL